MEWKKETLSSVWKMNKEKLIFLFCSGLLLFLISIPGGEPGKEAGTLPEKEALEAASPKVQKAEGYEEALEERIQEILKDVDGVGAVDVMVVLKASEEKILRVDKNSSSSVMEEPGSGETTSRVTRQEDQSETTVLSGQDQGPIVEKEIKPEISGIVISADGGGSAVVKAEISGAMEALFGLPPHKIRVLKRAGGK